MNVYTQWLITQAADYCNQNQNIIITIQIYGS